MQLQCRLKIESANTDAVDLLLVNIGCGATISAPDISVTGKIKITLNWATSPANVSLEIVWSKASFAGNWMLNTFVVPFDASCTGGVPDTEIPALFTAIKGAVTGNSIELLLNATDNSGTVIYTITYGSKTLISTGVSGVQKSFIVGGLSGLTDYSFSVVAKDAVGNAAVNNPLIVTAKTTDAAINTECNGCSTASSQGDPFIIGYNYSFSTSGTSVTATFELLDTKVGLVGFLWNTTTGFVETQMTGTGQNFSLTITGQTPGSVIKLACKFAYSGGFAVTKTFNYTVGNDCTGGIDTQAPTSVTATKGAVTSNSVELLLNATDNSGAVLYDISYGTTTVTTSEVSGVQKSFIVSGLTSSTNYVFSVVAKDAAGNKASPLSVSASTGAVIDGPSTAAPIPPTFGAGKVISIFSDTYTNLTGTNFNPYWNQKTIVTTAPVNGNNTLKYANLDYQGTELSGAVNALTMKILHIDVWTSDGTTLQITPISDGPKEKLITLTPLTLNSWKSYDIDLTLFTGVDLSGIFQFRIQGTGTFYIDNLYFYDNTTTVDTQAPTAFTVNKGAVISDAVELLLNATDNSGAINYKITYGTTTLNTGGVSGKQKSYTVSGLKNSTDYSFSVVAKDITGNIAINSPITVTAKTAGAIPSAPTPTRTASSVISIFSDTYTNVQNTDFFPGWGQTTVASIIQLGNNNSTLKYSKINYQGISLGSTLNVSTMVYLHIDVYTENETSLKITPISVGKELLVPLSPLVLNTWNSFDVPLSSFTGVLMSNIIQFKIQGTTGKTVYMDNLYFHDGTTSVSELNQDILVSIFPSLVSNKLTVRSSTEINQVIFINIIGQTVRTVIVNDLEKTIDLNTFSEGNYIVTVKLANGQQSTQKILKF